MQKLVASFQFPFLDSAVSQVGDSVDISNTVQRVNVLVHGCRDCWATARVVAVLGPSGRRHCILCASCFK